MRKYILSALFVVLSFTSFAQFQITGNIVTSDGEPADQVNIELLGTEFKTVSNEAGNFRLPNIPNGEYIIRLSHIGLEVQEKSVTVSSADQMLRFTLTEDHKKLQEVTVRSATGPYTSPASIGKVAIDPKDLPQAIAIIGQTIIRDQQSQKMSDVVKNVNGVYLATTRGSAQETFAARGYSFSTNNMFRNGARVNGAIIPEVSSLEKVEVLKGSAAVLFGNVAPGGIINMVTKQPKFTRGSEFTFRTGSFGLLKPSFDIYGPLTKTVAYRLNGTYEKTKSFRDIVSSERFYIAPSLLYKISKRTHLLMQGDYLKHNFTPDFGIGSLNNTVIPDVPRSRFLGTSWQYNKAKQATFTPSLKHSFNDRWSLNVTGSFQQYSRNYYSTERIQAAANGDWARPLNRIESNENYFLGQADLTGKFNTGKIGHTLLVGIDGDKYITTSFTFNNPTIYDTINILNPDKFRQRTDIPVASKKTKLETPVIRKGAYVQDLISISSKLKLLAGLRWSSQTGNPVTTTYLQKDSVVKGVSKTDAAFSPKAGIVYRPTRSVSFFASYSNSFVINNGTDVFYNALPASIIDQYELGVKNDFFNGKLSANLTLYRIINNNLAQTAQYQADGITVNNNTALKELAGETTSNGIEIDISSQPQTGLMILAGYSFNDMRYTKTKQAKGNYIEGERLVNTPAHTANSSVFYTFQKGILKGFKTGALFFYTGKRFGGWNNVQPGAQEPAAASRLIPVKSFSTVDISAGYTYKKVSLLMKVSNVFNTYNYYVHENYSINPIAPTQFISTISLKL